MPLAVLSGLVFFPGNCLLDVLSEKMWYQLQRTLVWLARIFRCSVLFRNMAFTLSSFFRFCSVKSCQINCIPHVAIGETLDWKVLLLRHLIVGECLGSLELQLQLCPECVVWMMFRLFAALFPGIWTMKQRPVLPCHLPSLPEFHDLFWFR
jgi:hypothetical protein